MTNTSKGNRSESEICPHVQHVIPDLIPITPNSRTRCVSARK